ncbi:non-homologous end-joining DNA ligase [Streptacidiphilus sp. EB129]|uniref:non-homologous end-joining DNA ligase n=1 Tax=Streptacidiphilus sp. EB129 TaxID=3156262 RepID=UPI003514047E
MPDRVPVQVDGRTLTLSHLDKPLWPTFTKGEALHYYAQIAPALLPHTADRPASFVRFPDGVDGPRFYAKTPPAGLPDWVTTAPVPGKEGPKDHVVVGTLAELVVMANLYALEIHVPQWTATAGPERHDRLVIDLDPGDGADITDCCRVALLVRERLAEDGLGCWAKTTGSKGLHLYAPITGSTGEEAAGYARTVAQRLEADHPELVVAKMTKALRRGRVFLDYSQNATSKTTAAPYTLRATPEPGVSTPLTWPEIERCGSPAELAFTPAQVLTRLADLGDQLAGLLAPDSARPLPD